MILSSQLDTLSIYLRSQMIKYPHNIYNEILNKEIVTVQIY